MVSRDDEVWAATRVVAMHTSGRCAHCTRDGCRMLVWARAVRGRWAEDGYPLPPLWPAYEPEVTSIA